MAVAGGIGKFFPDYNKEPVGRNVLIIHVALIVSILGSQYALFAAGRAFPWHVADPFLIFYAASALFALWLLGSLGIWYALSAFLQQAMMLSMAFVLYPAFPLWILVLLIVPIYTLAHLLKVRYAWSRMALFFAWDTVAVVGFSIWPSVWFFSAIHTLAGVLLIKWDVLYPKFAIPKGLI